MVTLTPALKNDEKWQFSPRDQGLLQRGFQILVSVGVF